MTGRLPDRSGNQWLLSNYVFDADGHYVGLIHQRRRLEQRSDGTTRILQICEPHLRVPNHPMAAFAGEWTFDLSYEGRIRRYQGPDMIGAGLAWGNDALTARGVWPRFGYNYTSFSVLISPERQITGEKFYKAGQLVANVIGIGVPEVVDAGVNPFPAFGNPIKPQEIASTWHGTSAIFDPGWRVQAQGNVIRLYGGESWRDQVELGSQSAVELHPDGDSYRVRGTMEGTAKRSGWLLEYSAVSIAHEVWQQDTVEVLDSGSKTLVTLTHAYVDGALAQVTITRFKPNLI
ncbi:MAG: hypothetical protein U0528_20145 [Anaerolineae bacterium]|nr:hypothetical protein [Anaerolineae bacterium]